MISNLLNLSKKIDQNYHGILENMIRHLKGYGDEYGKELSIPELNMPSSRRFHFIFYTI